MVTPDRPRVPSISPPVVDDQSSVDPSDDLVPPFRLDEWRWAHTLLGACLAVLVVAAVSASIVLAVVHARDRYQINIASGSWIALAWHTLDGTFYPPLRDGEGNFGGTRYMPLHIVAHAAASRMTGELLLSGRVIGFSAAAAWVLAIVALGRQRNAPWLISAAMAATILFSPVGIQALCTIRSDGLAIALQLWALWIIGRSDRPLPAVCAGILCALGFLAKLTAVWAALAIGIWLLWRNRSSLFAFVLSGLLFAGASLVAIHVISDGRMLENLTSAGGAGWVGWRAVVTWSPQRLMSIVSEWSPALWMLTPIALVSLLLALSRRDLQPVHLAWMGCCAMMLVLFADVGVGANHVIELAAVTGVVAADFWHRAAGRPLRSDRATPRANRSWTPGQCVVAAGLACVIVGAFFVRLHRDVAGAWNQLRTGEVAAELDPHSLELMFADARVLSDDPLVAVMCNQRPVLTDAFMFRAMGKKNPQWHDELIARIERCEFDYIVLSRAADPESWWYRELFLGSRVVRAMNSAYAFDAQRSGYWIYRPRNTTSAAAAP